MPNSYTYVLMVIDFLQSCSPPVLPCLQEAGPGVRAPELGRLLSWGSLALRILRSICAFTQEAVISTAGFDLTDPSVLTQTQWAMICSQFKTVYPKIGATSAEEINTIKKVCSPRLAKMVELSSKKCSGSSGNSQKANEQMGIMMCTAVKAMASFKFCFCIQTSAEMS